MENSVSNLVDGGDMERKKEAIVICGFPGIGKTTLLDRVGKSTILDSDSSNFSWANQAKNERNPDWPGNYIDYIKKNHDKADVILVSSHDVVRNALVNAGIKFTLVYPSLQMREEYIKRYKDRGNDEKFVKLLETNYENWIKELMAQKGCTHVVLQSGQYLSDVINNIK